MVEFPVALANAKGIKKETGVWLLCANSEHGLLKAHSQHVYTAHAMVAFLESNLVHSGSRAQ